MKTTETIQEQLSNPQAVRKIKDWLLKHKNKGRFALARFLCRTLDIADRLGKPRLAGIHKALRVLESRGFWKLPQVRGAVPHRHKPRRLNTAVAPPWDVPARVEQVQGMRLVEVPTQEDQLFRTWNELMLTEHPLRDCRLVGRQLRYLIGSDHGWLGAIGFGS